MVLDFVLGHAEVEWLGAERDKVALFAEGRGVPLADLPQRAFHASTTSAASTTRYFSHKMPVAVAEDSPAVQLAYLATDTTGRGLEQFLTDHARLLAWLPAWSIVATGTSPAALAACESAFARYLGRPKPTETSRLDDLRWLLSTRHLVDRADLAGLSVPAIDRYRSLVARLGTGFDTLYTEWRRHGEPALAAHASSGRPARSIGHLVTERLTFDYSQFGSLPGVA